MGVRWRGPLTLYYGLESLSGKPRGDSQKGSDLFRCAFQKILGWSKGCTGRRLRLSWNRIISSLSHSCLVCLWFIPGYSVCLYVPSLGFLLSIPLFVPVGIFYPPPQRSHIFPPPLALLCSSECIYIPPAPFN